MKKLLFSSLILSLLIFAGCQQAGSPEPATATQQTQTQETQTQETKKSGMKIEMIYPDGSTQVVSDFNEEPIKTDLVSGDNQSLGKGMVITADGFSPKELTLKVGETLIIQNMDEAPHWPASDPHPVHTDYKDFDVGHGMAKDETYSAAFSTPGVYGIHDHLNPSVTATITVEE